jgi:predicted dehydrogenase
VGEHAVSGATEAPIRAGLIGGGFMGEVHSRALRAQGATVVGIASSSAASAALAAARLGITTAHPDVESLLADDSIDVIHVLTPNSTHHALAAAAIEAGKHVVCEKPLATTVEDAAELTAAAARSGVVAAVPFVYRFHPLVRELRDRVATGATGRLLSVQGSYLQDWLLEQSDDNWRVDAREGGESRAFADIGSHLCDLLEFSAGERIVRLSASTRTVHPARASTAHVMTEDLVGVLAELAGGAVVSLLVSQVAPGRKNGLVLDLHGDRESLRFAQERPDELWIGRRRGSELLLRDGLQLHPDAERLSVLPAGHPLGYQDAFTAFVGDVISSIRGSTPEGLPVFADGLRAARLTAAVLDSAHRGEWVDTAE